MWNRRSACLKGQVRENAYRKALALYAPGRVVVDVGAGWGHLTRWALDAGAERVIAIEADFVVPVERLRESSRRKLAARGRR